MDFPPAPSSRKTVVLISGAAAEDAPSPFNPLGLKGAGEGGINGGGAAIAGSVEDALQSCGTITRLPITPQRLKMRLGQTPS
jgi:CO/xanthine dehydrogenase Mo-binding subunit